MATIPSIAMIPSGVKASKLYSVLPTDGTGDFTTTRASVATRVNENGLIEEVAANVPRLDYSDGGCPSLLLEGTSTNLITYSEDYNQRILTNTTIDSNVVASPRGGIDASRINFNAVSNSLFRFVSSSGDPDGKTYIYSIYLKADSSTSVIIGILGSGGGLGYITKTVNLTNEWQRFDVSSSFVGTGDNVRIRVLGTEIGSIFAWGSQLEENSYSTSYIKNEGTALGVTRVADTASGAGSSTVINSTEGVLYAEISALVNDLSFREIAISDGTNNNRIELRFSNLNSEIDLVVRSIDSSVQSNFGTTSYDVTNFNKVAIRYKLNDVSLWVNGVKINTDTIATMPINLSELAFDNGDGSNDFYGKTKSVQVYTTALSDSELTTLTTI